MTILTADEKLAVLRGFQWNRNLHTFVETGTADGFTTLGLADDFDRLITIELDYDRYLHVTTADLMRYPNILPLWGDSARVLREVAQFLEEPALFWLDAHYSGGARGDKDTPIEDELNILGGHVDPRGNDGITELRHVILIDDARLFGDDPAYPTLGWVQAWAEGHRYEFVVTDDIICLTPR